MSIHFEQKIKKTNKTIRLIDNLASDKRSLVVWWYCGVYKNVKVDSQPNILIAFRELTSGNNLSEDLVYYRVPLTSLGQVRIGSIWNGGTSESEFSFETKRFSLDFSKQGWSLNSFFQSNENKVEKPYPTDIYPLKYDNDKNWVIEFKLQTGGKLVIPCLEFFYRCYGRSAELKRILTTYPWQGFSGCAEDRIFSPLDEPEEQGKWKVKLKKRLVNGDIVFLAHVKYENYSRNVAKTIYAQIESEHDPAGKKPAFIKVAPWFKGPADLKVRGIPFDNGKSFLALQIIGCSDPIGVPIHRDRENTNKVDHPADDGGQGTAWNGMPEKMLIKPPEIIDLTSDIEPSHGHGAVELEEPDFEILNEPRVVKDVRRDKAKDSSGIRSDGKAESFSSGDIYGNDKGVGYASSHARPVLESNGVLRDMWDAIIFISKKRPGLIRHVEWFTFEDGYSNAQEPKLITIPPFDDAADTDISTDIRNWPYLEPVSKLCPRGILVIRLRTEGRFIHIIEVQRRVKTRVDDEGKETQTEESFKGFVCSLNDQTHFEPWLRTFISNIRLVKGVSQKLINQCPSRAAVFKHSVAGSDKVACEASVLNALSKMGVDV
ncbi:hypothetical protein [Aeromonas hydrophila]|nr:hypothetical protein [Aeromonas hydrophila]